MKCPHCKKEVIVPGRAYKNLESYNPNGSVLVSTECCRKGVWINSKICFTIIPYGGDKTEDDWGEKFNNKKMKIKRLGFDIDGVLADFGNHFLNYLRFEDKSPPKEWNEPRFKNHFNSIKDDALFWETIPIIEHSNLIKNLFVNQIECYCTARPLSMTEITKEWLWKNGFPYAEVINIGLDGKKSNYLKSKIDVFVDDGFHNYEDLNNNDILCYLMTRSHNEKEIVDKRVNDLIEFKNKLDKL